jgi:hypothetical protein
MQLGTTEKRNEGRVKPKQPTPVRIVSATKNATVITIVFDQPVVLKGTPQYTVTGATADPVSAASPAIDTVAITYSASIAAATDLNIPSPVEPGVRSKDGGYVADSTFKLT